ncbi:MAG: hypothetical protein R2801_01475 [Chitinophagales bacterium]
MKALYILVLSFTFLLSCDRNEPNCCTIIDAVIDIQYKDVLGRDLLDQSKPYAYQFSAMEHYYIDSLGVVQEGFHQSEHEKEMSLYFDIDSVNTLRVFPYRYYYKNGTMVLTDIIQLYELDSDTIVSEIVLTSNSQITKKVWYNGVLKYNYDTGDSRLFVITK